MAVMDNTTPSDQTQAWRWWIGFHRRIVCQTNVDTTINTADRMTIDYDGTYIKARS
jgi:hypothetical protein